SSDRLPCGMDAAVECGVRDDPSLPDGCDQVVLADDMLAIVDQIDQQVEHLRLDRDQFAARAQFAAVGVQGKIVEEIQQLTPHKAVGPQSSAASWSREI